MSAEGANTTSIAVIGSNIDVPVPMNRCTGTPYRGIKLVSTHEILLARYRPKLPPLGCVL